MRKSATNEDVLSTREAAERLGVALRTVQLWVEGGVLPAWKTAGGHRRISRVAVERLLEERRAALAGGGEPVAGDTGGAAAGRIQVLLVEDEPQQRELLGMVIRGWGLPIDLRSASDGFDALLQIGRDCPDLLVTDLRMPGMDGFRMVAALRGVGQGYDGMDIVVVTAMSASDIAARGGLPPDVRVFEKPVRYELLEQLVRERIARRQSAAAGQQPA